MDAEETVDQFHARLDDAYINDCIAAVKKAGYTVLPKERIRKVTVSEAVDYRQLEVMQFRSGFYTHMYSGLARNLGTEIAKSDSVLWTESDQHHMRKVYTGEVRLIVPKPASATAG